MSAARRMRSVAGHLAMPVAAANNDTIAMSQMPDARASGLYREPRLLTNQQMADFLGQGFLSLPVDDVPAEVHSALHENAERKWEQSGQENGAGLGNNIWPAVPQLGHVLRSAVVHGGIQSILGEGYVMNAHRHMHNSSTQGDQAFHKDTNNRGAYMHRPRNLIIFYVPAGATLHMGPTAIIPGSALMSVDNADWTCLQDPADLTELWDGAVEHKLTAPAHTGVVVLLHQAMFHRGTARLSDVSAEHPFRPMMKFIFSSTRAPTTTPSWNAASPADWSKAGVPPGMEGACGSLWRWLGGDAAGGPQVHAATDSVTELGARLTAEHAHGDEPSRNNASYALGEIAASGGRDAAQAVELLLAAITHETCEGARRVAVPGLAAAGDAAVPSLIALLEGIDVEGAKAAALRVLAYGADALGEAAEGEQVWMGALEALGEKHHALDAAMAAGQSALPWITAENPNNSGSAGSVVAAVESIGQRAVAAGNVEACELASRILLRALDGPSAGGAVAAVASIAVADQQLLRPATTAALLSKVREAATGGEYRERAVASEALKRLIAPRAETALARAQRRVVQSLLEAEWASPEDDPRQNGEIAGRQAKVTPERPAERPAESALFALRNA